MRRTRPNMKQLLVLVIVVVVSGFSIPLAAAPPKKGGARPHAAPASTDAQYNLASQRINALETLYDMQATREQMLAMQKVAKETAESARERKPVRIKQDLKHVMQELHDALLAVNNPDRIESLEDKFGTMVENQKIEFDDDVEITQAAWNKAPEIARSLDVSQVASLVS